MIRSSRSNGYKQISTVCRVAFIVLIILFILLPFYVAFCYAFKYREDLYLGILSFPTRPTLSNFSVVLRTSEFQRSLINSLITTVPTVLILMVVSSMAAYPLARFNGKFYKFTYILFSLGILIPFPCIMLPLYSNMYHLGLVSTATGYIIARVGMQVSISLLVITSFVKTIPYEIEEAAAIDGANRLRVFCTIVFPLMIPVVATQTVLNVIYSWNDYNVAIVLLRDNISKTLPLTQQLYLTTEMANMNLAFAFFLLAMLPILIVYFMLQKYVVSGITTGAVKG